jgi:hypothetical protein
MTTGFFDEEFAHGKILQDKPLLPHQPHDAMHAECPAAQVRELPLRLLCDCFPIPEPHDPTNKEAPASENTYGG